MKPEDCAANLEITLDELFKRAYQQCGGAITSPSSSSGSDLAWYRKWKNAPIYVKKFVAEHERANAQEQRA